MLPILLDLKIIKIYTFGVFAVLAFFWGLYFFWKHLKLTSYKEEEMFDSVFVGLLWSLFFGRLFYVIGNFDDFGFNILKFILINGYPGLSAWGMVCGATIGLYIFLKQRKIDVGKAIDYYVTPALVAMAVLKVGSFFAGADVGTKTKFFLSVTYAGHEGSRHITALYEALMFAIFAYVTKMLLLAIRREKVPHGFAYLLFLNVFSFTYLALDTLKENHLYFAGINVNVVVSLVVFFVTTTFFIYHFRKEIVTNIKMALLSTYTYVAKNISKFTKTITKRTAPTAKKS